jgi:nucleoside-diphosphate-sugar epimerase
MLMSQKILITGATGNLGTVLTTHLKERFDLVLTDVTPPKADSPQGFTQANIAEFEAIRPLFDGVHTVIHLAADPNMEAEWESLLPSNLIGLYNVFEAAHQAGCQRVIFASSINAVFGYPPDIQVRVDMPVRPPNLYGATKAWGEAVARYYADQKDLSAICLRFGWVQPADNPEIKAGHPYLDILLTYRDLTRLIDCCLKLPDDFQFGIFHGISNNRWKRLDISETRRVLGYEPLDDAFVIAGMVETEAD